MLTYKGKVLTKYKNKKGGKNHSEVDGFYRDPDGGEFFIKKPIDPKELFTELLAGLVLQEIMQRGLIDKIYHASLICAELIQFEDGSYGLIQPKVSFKELFKIIGTGYRDGSDRDPLVEMFFGPQSYLLLTQLRQYFGLANALMFSLFLGDHSVHSGNVVCLDVISASEMAFIQFARIDWGAAFRYFGHKKNNDELLHPFEYQGWFNPKGFTKGYFLNYKKIKGLFPAVAEHAKAFQKQVNEELLVDIVASVLRKLPVDLMEDKTKIELAKYLCIESFNEVVFGEEGNYQQFSRDLAGILYGRLNKITAMQDFSMDSNESDLSQITYVESLPTAIALPVNMVTPFAEQMKIWLNILSSSDERSVFDFNTIKLTKLAKQYNCFRDSLLRQAERLNQYSDDAFSSNESGVSQLFPESAFLRSLFTLEVDLNPDSLLGVEKRIPYKQAYWMLVEKVLSTSFNAIVTIRVLQNTQNSTELGKESAIHFLFDALKECLEAFSTGYQALLTDLEETLSHTSGVQLATICLNEMEFINSSLLIRTVLKNQVLWTRMVKVINEEYKYIDSYEAAENIIKLCKVRDDYILFLTLVSELSLITRFDTKGVIVNEISRIFERLPEVLQTDLASILNKIQLEFKEQQRRRSICLEELEQFNEEPALSSGHSDSSLALPESKSRTVNRSSFFNSAESGESSVLLKTSWDKNL